jgi:hypothetical protein
MGDRSSEAGDQASTTGTKPTAAARRATEAEVEAACELANEPEERLSMLAPTDRHAANW